MKLSKRNAIRFWISFNAILFLASTVLLGLVLFLQKKLISTFDDALILSQRFLQSGIIETHRRQYIVSEEGHLFDALKAVLRMDRAVLVLLITLSALNLYLIWCCVLKKEGEKPN